MRDYGTAKWEGGDAACDHLEPPRSGYRNERSRDEVIRIERGRCRWVYEIGVADDPHVFALASGILSHNSKPSPMPESVRDRCTKSHEYLFLLSKKERCYFDADAIAKPSKYPGETHNKRSVWTVTTKSYTEAHFATFPPKLIEPCILAGSRRGDVVLDPFGGAGTTGVVANARGRKALLIDLSQTYAEMARKRVATAQHHMAPQLIPDWEQNL